MNKIPSWTQVVCIVKRTEIYGLKLVEHWPSWINEVLIFNLCIFQIDGSLLFFKKHAHNALKKNFSFALLFVNASFLNPSRLLMPLMSLFVSFVFVYTGNSRLFFFTL